MIKALRRTLAYRKLLREDNDTRYHVSYVSEESFLIVAQKLHASVYLEEKYIEAHHVGSDGRMSERADPYQKHADYFVVSHTEGGHSEVIATARQIRAKSTAGHESFPTVRQLDLYPKMRAVIGKIDPSRCVEISGLAKKRGHSSYAALLLYRQMWQHSVRSNHLLWIMACDSRVYAQLQFLFGDALTQIGEPSVYMGSEVIPATLEVHQSLDALLSAARVLNPVRRSMKLEMVRFFVRGMDPELLSPHHIAELKRLSIFKNETS